MSWDVFICIITIGVMTFQEYFILGDISRSDIYEMIRYSITRGPNHVGAMNSKKLARFEFVVSVTGNEFFQGLVDWWTRCYIFRLVATTKRSRPANWLSIKFPSKWRTELSGKYQDWNWSGGPCGQNYPIIGILIELKLKSVYWPHIFKGFPVRKGI